jgi:RNA recognition motif-containing protein
MTDQALQEAFSECGSVKSGVIITRGRRSLGYGFVEFDAADVASSAVDKMNKKELFGRQIKVEVAKDPSERDQVNGGGRNDTTWVRGEKKGGFGPSGGESGSGGDEMQKSNPPTNVNDPSSPNPNRNINDNDSRAQQQQIRRRRRKIRKNPPKDKLPSKTTLFVANLPFSVDDEQLKKIFADTNSKDAHVVHTRNGRSRGYGFVEFHNETDQLDALKVKNKVEVEGNKGKREISVTVSNSVSSTPEDENTQPPPPSTPQGIKN